MGKISDYYQPAWQEMLDVMSRLSLQVKIIETPASRQEIDQEVEERFPFTNSAHLITDRLKLNCHMNYFWLDWNEEVAAFAKAINQATSWECPSARIHVIFNEESLPTLQMQWKDILRVGPKLLEIEDGWIISKEKPIIIERRSYGVTKCCYFQ